MLHNFQLVAISKSGGQSTLYRIPLHQALQVSLAKTWASQLAAFIDDIQVIDFDAGYTPEAHERFRLSDYPLPAWLEGRDSVNLADLDPIAVDADGLKHITAIAGFARDDAGNELILFQNFSRSHVIEPGSFLLLQHNTYVSNTDPGLTLSDKLSAVYLGEHQALLFHNFRTANTFLPLAEIFEEASEEQIREVLSHAMLATENVAVLAIEANQWFRKRFAMLRDSEILDRYTAHQIAAHSVNYQVKVEIQDDQIVFPSDKAAAKRLLQFLNEELFRGAITETLYETNSKREAD